MKRIWRQHKASVFAILLVATMILPRSLANGQTISDSGHGFFIQNVGQFKGDGQFVVPGASGMVWFSSDGIWVTRFNEVTAERNFATPTERMMMVGGENIKIWFNGANLEPALEPQGLLETKVSYLIGSDRSGWLTDVPAYSHLIYRNLYPGIDLEIYADESGQLAWTYLVEDQADLAQLNMVVSGAENVRAESSSFVIQSHSGEFVLPLPDVTVRDQKSYLPETSSSPDISKTNDGFEIQAPYYLPSSDISSGSALDGAEDLIFSTLIGGSGQDSVYGLAVDEDQESFIIGDTNSVDFPATPGTFDPSMVNQDAFVARFNPEGTGLIYATFLGGSSVDTGNGIAVENNIAYVAGDTLSHDFPLTNLLDDESDAYVAALTPDGTDLIYATLHGGSDLEYGNGIDVEAGYAYLIGSTSSADIPGGSTSRWKGFAAKFSPAGTRVYGVTFGGNADEAAYDIDVSGGKAFISGYSTSRLWGLGSSGLSDGYFIELGPVGEQLLVIKYGGTLDDWANQVVVLENEIILAGHTSSLDLPVTEGAFAGGTSDIFISRYDLTTSQWNYATYLGGASAETVLGLSVDSGGGIQIAGSTSSSDFPTTADAYQSTLGGGTDAYVARFDLAGSDPAHRSYSSLLGGTSSDGARALDIDLYGYTYLAGFTTSSDFPVTAGAFDNSLSGSQDGFLTKMTVGPIPSIVIEKHTNGADADLAPGPSILYGGTVNWAYMILNTGPVELAQVTVDDSDTQVVPNCPKNTLAAGESMTCTASGSAIAGQYNNIGTVQAIPPVGPAVSDSDPSHYFGALPAISVVKKTNGVDSAPPGADILVGSTVNWTYLVSNTGNVSLGNITVTDSDQTIVVVCPKTALAAGESMTCTASGTAIGGNYSNIGTVTADPPDSLPQVSDSEADYYHGVGPDVMITKDISLDGGATWLAADAAPFPKLLSGHDPKYRITVTNNGDTALDNISVTDSDFSLSTCTFNTSLVKDGTTSCTITLPWAAGQKENTASVTASYTDQFNNTMPVSDSNSASYFGAQTGLTIIKELSLDNGVSWLDADTPGTLILLSSGFAPKYRITLQNTGNVSLDVALNDPTLPLPGICKSGILQSDDQTPGGNDQRVCEVTATWSAGTHTNTATATSSFSDNGGHTLPITISESASYFGANPGLTLSFDISIDGGTSWLPADTSPGPYLLSGTNPQYRLTLSNTGNVRIENILVNDDELPLIDCGAPISLNAGSQKTCSATTGWSGGSHHFTVTSAASFMDSAGNEWTSNLTNDVNYFGAVPALAITKDVSIDSGSTWLPADSAPGPDLLNGYAAPKYRLTLTNSGNVELSATISDPSLTLPVECSQGILSVGGSRQCTVTGIWGAGSRQNTAQGSAIYTDTAGTQRNITSENSAYYYGAVPQIDLEELVSGDGGVTWQDADTITGPYLLSTGNLQFKLIFDNTGNVDISSLVWNDPLLVLTSCSLPSSLAPAAEPVSCIVSDAWEAGQVNHTASASAAFSDTAANTASPADNDQTHYFGAAPSVSIIKNTNGEDANTAPGPYILVGDQVAWTYVISNTGNVPLTGITVTDDNGTASSTSDDFTAVCGNTELAAGAQQTCSANGTADEGQYTNIGTVLTQPKVGLTNIGGTISSSDGSNYFGALISFTLEKSTNGNSADDVAPGEFIPIGDPVDWEYVVTNTSNVNLQNIEIWDDLGSPGPYENGQLICTITQLQPGKSNSHRSCTYSGTATAGQYGNVGTAHVNILGKDYTTTNAGHYYGYDPDQVIDLGVALNAQVASSVPGIYILTGESIEFIYTIYNFSPSPMVINGLIDDNGTPSDLTDDVSVCSQLPFTIESMSTATCSHTFSSALAGLHTHTGVVNWSISAEPGTHTITSSYFGVSPGISLSVLTNGVHPSASLDLLVMTGNPINWDFTITNTSNIVLTGISLVDDQYHFVSCPKTILQIGETMECGAEASAQAGAQHISFTVKGVWPDDFTAFYGYDDSNYYGLIVSATLDLKVNGDSSSVSPGIEVPIDTQANLTYDVANTSNYQMINIVVTDNAGNAITCPKSSLIAGESMTCSAQEMVSLGVHARTAEIIGFVNGHQVSATDTAYFTGVITHYYVFLPLIKR